MNWLDDDGLYDVVPSKFVVPPEDTSIFEVGPGTICRVAYCGQFYKARVIECGEYGFSLCECGLYKCGFL